MTEEKIMTLHPTGKQGVNILKRRYDVIKEFILQTIEKRKEISFEELTDQAVDQLSDTFDGKVVWYIVTVKLDLEARKIIERIPKTSPHKLRMKMNKTDQSIVVQQHFKSPIARVWKTITDQEQMKQWFFPQMETFRPEIGFETRFDVSFDGKTYTHHWKIVEVIPLKRITYNWKYGGLPGDSFVTFVLVEIPDGTQLTLTHQITEKFPKNDPAFSRESTLSGWNYFIKNSLKEYLERV